MLTLCLLLKYFLLFCHLQIFLKINFLKKIFQEYHQRVKYIGFRSGPILVQTVCKSNQQRTLVGKKIKVVSLKIKEAIESSKDISHENVLVHLKLLIFILDCGHSQGVEEILASSDTVCLRSTHTYKVTKSLSMLIATEIAIFRL